MYLSRWMPALALTSASLFGCSPQAPSESSTENASSWRLDQAPANPMSVVEAKTTAEPGASVTVEGKIGGRLNPITPESGLFVIVDTSVSSCDELPGDSCPTPWDYCCETPGDIAAHAATVQLRDASGQPIALTEEALAPLDRVVVAGTVAPSTTGVSLVIHASEIFVP